MLRSKAGHLPVKTKLDSTLLGSIWRCNSPPQIDKLLDSMAQFLSVWTQDADSCTRVHWTESLTASQTSGNKSDHGTPTGRILKRSEVMLWEENLNDTHRSLFSGRNKNKKLQTLTSTRLLKYIYIYQNIDQNKPQHGLQVMELLAFTLQIRKQALFDLCFPPVYWTFCTQLFLTLLIKKYKTQIIIARKAKHSYDCHRKCFSPFSSRTGHWRPTEFWSSEAEF